MWLYLWAWFNSEVCIGTAESCLFHGIQYEHGETVTPRRCHSCTCQVRICVTMVRLRSHRTRRVDVRWRARCERGLNVKVALGPELIPLSIGSQLIGDSVIKYLAVGCHYFLPGPRLPFQPQSIAALSPSYTTSTVLSDRGTCVWTTCPELLHDMMKIERLRVKPAAMNSWLRVQRPHHYTTTPH